MFNRYPGGRFRRPTRGNFRNGRNRGFSGRKVKFFDPSFVVEKQVASSPVIETYTPKYEFKDFLVSPKILENVQRKGYVTPTPIQDQAIPELLAGRDLIGIAKTGSGKTAAFLIPLIDKVFKNPGQKVLIVVPTRELAVQIQAEFWDFAKGLNISSVICIGGVGMGGQIHGLRRNYNFVIGTPGRLMDLARQRFLKFPEYKNVVLDEVDRMLDMGFIKDVSEILNSLPLERQTLCFSATMPENVRQIVNRFVNDPVTFVIRSNEPTSNVSQKIIKLEGKPKIEVLHELLTTVGFNKVLIFGRTKRGIERLAIDLKDRGLRVEAIHGNKSQNQRIKALDGFKAGYVKVLLATDIVARGIDIDDITHVINYELPGSYEDYIHRIGRTGRADKRGVALTLI